MNFRLLLVVCVALIAAAGADASDCGSKTICFTYPPMVIFTSGLVNYAGLGDTSSCPVKPWTAAQIKARVIVEAVEFDKVFAEPPDVQISLTRLDSASNQNIRYQIRVFDITTTGCNIEFGIWCSTKTFSSQISYQAIGYAPDDKKPEPPSAS